MTRADTGLLLFVEEPGRTASRWQAQEPQGAAAVDLMAAVHSDLLEILRDCQGTVVYLAPVAAEDEPYCEHLAAAAQLELLEVPMAPAMQRWDSGLSILYNRCAHRKVICMDAAVPDVSAEDISRARRKLELYRMILGREGEDRCWLVGFNGYEEVLGGAELGPQDTLHPLLQSAGRVGLDVSLLDTKHALTAGAVLETLRPLAHRPGYLRVQSALRRHGLHLSPRTRPEGD